MKSTGSELEVPVECSDSVADVWEESWGALEDTEWHRKRKRKKPPDSNYQEQSKQAYIYYVFAKNIIITMDLSNTSKMI
jgi:hypothetical protein